MIDLSIRRPVATAAIYLALMALGAYSFQLIPVELLPDVQFPRLTVTASWRGASPEALEASVTAPLEAAAQQVGGVRGVSSASTVDPRGTGSTARIEIEFARDTRMEFAELELGERIAALREELPEGVRPTVEPWVPEEFAEEDVLFLSYDLRGPYTLARLARMAEEEIRSRLLATEGVADVSILGGRQRLVEISLDPDRLAALDLRPVDVDRRIREISAPRPAGAVTLEGREFALSVRTRAADAAELEQAVVASRPQGTVRLGDVGEVRDRAADPTGYHRIDGQPTVTVVIRRQAGTNAIRLADELKGRVAALEAELLPGAVLELGEDGTEDIRAQLTELRLRALAAAAVIFLVLILFLRSLGAVLVIFATIGFSVLIAVNGLYLGGFSLNVLTLAGLAWGFGLVVDNGIVVLENVERHRARGSPPDAAAERGARQVLLPVLAATLTTAIVLVPFLFLQGELRIYYLPLGYAVGFSILASLFVAFTFVPAMATRLGPGPAAPSRQDEDVAGPAPDAGPASPGSRPRDAPSPLYLRGYRAVIRAALRHPVVLILICAGALYASWRLFDGHVTRGVNWSSFWGERTYISVQITFPRGAGLERTDALARSFERRIETLPDVERYETVVRPQFASIRITFPAEVENTATPVMIRERMVAYSYGFSGADVRVYGFGPSFYGGGGSPPNYSLQVLGYNYLRVQEIGQELTDRLERFSRIRDVDPNASGRWYRQHREFEYTLAPDRAALGGYGLGVEEMLRYVSAAVREGQVGAGRLRLGEAEVPYALRVDRGSDFDLLALQRLRVPTASGRRVRVEDVARVGRRDVLAQIHREDQHYQRTVAWEFRGPRKLGDVYRDAVLEATDLPPGYRIEEQRSWGWSEEDRRQVYLAVLFAVVLIYLVTAALFESLAAPLVVLLTLPLSLVGVFLIFFYADATFTRTAYIGTIMMAGIVVNNAILIVYHIGELRERLPTGEAILRGTLERIRPILMTTLTTVFGLLPLVLFAGSQDANIWQALALATIGGLLSSTLFVPVAIPVAYRWLVARS